MDGLPPRPVLLRKGGRQPFGLARTPSTAKPHSQGLMHYKTDLCRRSGLHTAVEKNDSGKQNLSSHPTGDAGAALEVSSASVHVLVPPSPALLELCALVHRVRALHQSHNSA